MTDSQEQGGRLEKLIETLELTQLSMAEAIGISQGYVSQMVSGSRNISRTVLQSITKKFQNVNVRWLITGEGQMFLEKKLDVVEEPSMPYGPDCKEDLFGDLRALLEHYEKRIAGLEGVVAALDARVKRLEGK